MPPKRVYIDQNLADKLSKVYPQKESGLNRAVTGFLTLRTAQLRTLRGRFTREELTGLLDAFNGTYLEVPQALPAREMLLVEMADSEELDNTSFRQGYEWPSLKTKLEQLTDFEAFFLLDEIERFWSTGQELDTFLALYETK